MTQIKVNRIALWVPLACSAAAFALVMANILAGVLPRPDEDASAHIFQLLISLQLPFVALFAATADWKQWHRAAMLLGLELAAIAVALLPVWLAGY